MTRPIDFFIIGAQKSGTTALYEYLGQHPDVFIPQVKELHYFVRDEFYRRGEQYLEPLYSSAPERSSMGGADVELLYYSSRCAERVHDYNPEMRLIAILRDPVDRAYSAYWYMRQLGFETVSTFEDALQKETERDGGTYFERSKLTYLRHGHYHDQLSDYLQYFDRVQLRVLLTSEFRASPTRTLRETFRWLGLSPDTSSMELGQRKNVTGKPRSLALQKLLRPDDSSVKALLRRALPQRLRLAILRYVRKPLMAWNVEDSSYPPMRDDTRRALKEYFRPHNEALARLLNRNLEAWQ